MFTHFCIACESKLVFRSSRKATVAKTVYSLGRPRACDRMPSLVGDRGPCVGAGPAGL